MASNFELSEYEQLRERNIARNREVMRALGLDATDFSLHAAHRSSTRTKEQDTPKRKRETVATAPSRRSSRVAGQAAVESGDAVEGCDGEEGPSVKVREQAALRGLEHEHAAAEEAHKARWAGKQGKISIVGTASYSHTLMRVRTMSESALANRVKAIERAAGKHAVGSCMASGKMNNPSSFFA